MSMNMANCIPSKCRIIPDPNAKYTISLIESEYNACCKAAHDQWLATLKCTGDYVFGEPNNPKQYTQTGAIPKKNSHQRRLQNSTLIALKNEIDQNLPTLVQKASFDDLWKEIRKIGQSIPGIGPVAIYDTALRLQQNLMPGKDPDYVYLHSDNGPLHGAKRYFKKKIGITMVHGVNGRKYSIDKISNGCRILKSNFPDFQSLSCKDIEHMLCIYHSVI